MEDKNFKKKFLSIFSSKKSKNKINPKPGTLKQSIIIAHTSIDELKEQGSLTNRMDRRSLSLKPLTASVDIDVKPESLIAR